MVKPYLFTMFRFLLILFSVLSLSAMSVMTQAHESRMVTMSESDHSAQMAKTEHMSSSMTYCVEDNICKNDSSVCDLICFGTGGFLVNLHAELPVFHVEKQYLPRLEAALIASQPPLHERPPISFSL
ncbi:hypothetical protein FHS77_001928 [Paenochrobactrum gallinarii]|uniref:Uncharacterized protein n=1 Tax=Paenochrobactrum gallinarii TaxID=643673 RepID=A0A841LTD7_9HYPH|nr:hypothetical protein [Paenochrobactrum gallinarii]MBB6261373.1 hypothetical protein [Paenochrobactrum gallinarii]